MSNFKDIARIGRDAEVRHTTNGTVVANFPAAVDVGFGDHKSTLWLDCSMFGKRAEGGLIQYLVKGAQIMIEGDINLRQYTKGDGTAGAAVTLNVQDLKLVGGQPQGQNQTSSQTHQMQPESPPQQSHAAPISPDPDPVDDFDSSIPF